jgi:hypothetical protein
MATGWFKKFILGTGLVGVDNGDGSITVTAPGTGSVPTTRTLTAGSGLTGGGTLAADRTFDVNPDGSTIEISADAVRVKDAGITEAKLGLSDNTTADVSTTKHGLTPKAPNDTSKFLRGDGTWAGVGGVTSVVATDTFWDAKGDLAVGASADAATKLPAGTNGYVLTADSAQTLGVKWGLGPILLYDYEVAGTDQATIDTFVDNGGGGVGALLSTAYHVLELWFYARSDRSAAGLSVMEISVNNDSGANYDNDFVLGIHTTLSGSSTQADTKWQTGRLAPARLATGTFSVFEATFPNYAGTVGHKIGRMNCMVPAQVTTDAAANILALGYRSTSALTRFKFACTASEKFKVGTRLMIFAR